jgi:isocitrate dehydrogenase (NAD+)
MIAATTMSRTFLKYQSNFLFSESAKRKVVLFPGNGIGPEISQSVIDIFKAANVPIEWEHHQIHTKGQTADGDLISQ